MLSFKNKKGFTLIELLIVIAVIGILVLLAVPKMLGHTKDAQIAQIKNDIKAYETAISVELLNDDKFIAKLNTLDFEDLKEKAEENSLFDKRGLINVDSLNNDKLFVIDKKAVDVDSKLKGEFFVNEEGLVFYYEKDLNSKGNVIEKEDVVLAQDSDFRWVLDKDGYTASNENGVGYYSYVGKGKKIVEIPHVINEHPMTSYYKMFDSHLNLNPTEVEKVVSTNSKITDMRYMFHSFRGETIDLSNFNTTNVTDMSFMFSYAKAKDINLSNFNTSKVENMRAMFRSSEAKSLKLSDFDTRNVTDMHSMFYFAEAKSIDVSKFNTKNVKDISAMFNSVNLEILDLTSFDTTNVTNMNGKIKKISEDEYSSEVGGLFGRSSIGVLKLGESFKTDKVKVFDGMFNNSKIGNIEEVVKRLDTSNGTSMAYMFYNYTEESLDLSHFKTNNVTDMNSMFRDSKAKNLNLLSFDTSNVTDMGTMFSGSQATILDLSSFDTIKVSNAANIFKFSAATEGYAKTQKDINRFSSSSGKPKELIFSMKNKLLNYS